MINRKFAMPRQCLPLLISLVLVPFAMAQDTTVPPADEEATAQEAATAAATAEAEPEAEPELFDDPGLDEQTYEEDEDVFVPTEEIPSDEPIPFPTNI